MNDIALNQFIFPNYVGINFDDKPITKKNATKKVIAIVNDEETEYFSRYEAARLLGISTSVIYNSIAQNKSITRRNGDVIRFKEISKD